MEYIRGSGALAQLFPVLISHPEMYTLGSILLHYIYESHFFFSHGCVHMGQMDFIGSIFFRFFSKLSGKNFNN